MALLFTKFLREDILLDAYTNQVVEFYSDKSVIAFKCLIVVNGESYEITPNNDGFYFNFKTIFKNLILDYFEDSENVELEGSDPSSFIKSMDSIYLAVNINYLVSFVNGETESHTINVQILQSTSNFQDRKKREIQTKDSFAILGKIEEGSNRTFRMTYWEGYPFDVQFYKKDAGNVKITNKSTGIDFTFNLPHKINRIFFSDTQTDSTIEDIFPLVDGWNELEFDTGELTTIFLEKKSGVCGKYLKWKNHEGGWSYWLFDQKNRTTRVTDDQGYINNDFQNLENNNFIKNIGKLSKDRLYIGAINIEVDKRPYLESLFDSPKVFLFMGLDFSKEEQTDWLAVKLMTDSTIVDDYQDRPFDINLELELPDRNVLML